MTKKCMEMRTNPDISCRCNYQDSTPPRQHILVSAQGLFPGLGVGQYWSGLGARTLDLLHSALPAELTRRQLLS